MVGNGSKQFTKNETPLAIAKKDRFQKEKTTKPQEREPYVHDIFSYCYINMNWIKAALNGYAIIYEFNNINSFEPTTARRFYTGDNYL